MRPTSFVRLSLLFAAALVVASCSDSPTGPDDPGSADLTALLNDMSVGNVASPSAIGTSAGVVAFSGVPSASANANACTFSSGVFTCPTVTINGVTFTRSFILRDAAGQVQSAFGPNVASIQSLTTAKGTVTATSPGGTSSFAIDRSEDMTLSGIHTADRTLNGHALSTLSGTFASPGGNVLLNVKSTETTENLVLPKPNSGSRWPQRGKITSTVETSATPNGQQRVELSMLQTITFNGTSVVTISITTGFGTTTCQIDLAKPGTGQVCVAAVGP
jgi:hypothetical protein